MFSQILLSLVILKIRRRSAAEAYSIRQLTFAKPPAAALDPNRSGDISQPPGAALDRFRANARFFSPSPVSYITKQFPAEGRAVFRNSPAAFVRLPLINARPQRSDSSHHGDGVQVPARAVRGGARRPAGRGAPRPRHGVPQPVPGGVRPGAEDDGRVAVPVEGGEQALHAHLRGGARAGEAGAATAGAVPSEAAGPGAGLRAVRRRRRRRTRRLAVSVVTRAGRCVINFIYLFIYYCDVQNKVSPLYLRRLFWS